MTNTPSIRSEIKQKRHYIQCECTCSTLQFDYDPKYKDLSIVMWKQSCERTPLNMYQRLSWCWEILTTGIPWTDYLCINDKDSVKEEVSKLKDYLNTIDV